MTVLRWKVRYGSLDVDEHDTLRDAVAAEEWNDGDHALVGYEDTDGAWFDRDSPEVREHEDAVEAERSARQGTHPPIVATVVVTGPAAAGLVPHQSEAVVEWCASNETAEAEAERWRNLIGADRVTVRPPRR